MAEGEDVVLTSDANKLVAHVTEFLYDGPSRVAVLRSDTAARVTHRTSLLVCPEITVTHDRRGKIVSAWCRGAGQLTHRDRHTDRVLLEAGWLTQMRLFPDPNSGWNLIEMQDQVRAEKSDQDMSLKADLIRLWYEPAERVGGAKTARRIDPDRARPSGLRKNRPHYLVATGRVEISSPQLEGQTERLEVAFAGADPSARADGTASTHRASGAVRKEPPPSAGFPETEAAGEKSSPLLPIPGSDSSTGPVRIEAQTIKVRMQERPGEPDYEVAEVWNEGRVRIVQPGAPQKTGGLELTGHRLHLVNTAPNRQVLHVFGVPAMIDHPEFRLEGPEISLDRAANQVSVNGPGSLNLLVERGFEGHRLNSPQPLTIQWDEQMTFDGLQAHFNGRIRAELEHSRMRCHDMLVELTEPIRLARSGARRRRVQIRRVVCQDAVEVDSYGYVADELTEIRKARCGRFSLDQITGRTEAVGPGELRFWRRGRGKRAAVSARAQARANAPLKAEEVQWEYTRIEFSGNTVGNLRQRQATFVDRVRIVYGPVDGPLGTINPDQLPKDAAEMQCERLEFAFQPETEAFPRGYIELTARGNAKLEGRTFVARADVISYDESKGLYVLSALGNREAAIWRQVQAGGDYSVAYAKRMRFIPSRNSLEFDRASRLHGTD
ncbi:MAG TPA: hypothetical protein EYP14_00315 [Planctomycetaceae bacterium]|nr:hypothetical protein [Planctomycetaceae bacterium]